MNKVLVQAVVASAALTFVGVTYNALNLKASAPLHVKADRVRISAPSDLEVVEGRRETMVPPEGLEARRRAMEEHGEERSARSGELPVTVPFTIEREVDMAPHAMDPSDMARGMAIQRREEIQVRLEEPNVPPEERAQLEMELDGILSAHFPKGGGEVEVVGPLGDGQTFEEYAAENPQVFEEAPSPGIFGQLDINNIFNKVWGLLQALILAWVSVKWSRRKKEA